jgi:hypothetical protein
VEVMPGGRRRIPWILGYVPRFPMIDKNLTVF